jgi:PHD/YefM family antitoxin component YafN of YafNO toxin-antitoxin module
MITANELNTRGACLEESLKQHSEATITVEGEERFVVMRVEQYHYLREMELEAALLESKLDLKHGNFSKDDIDAHVIYLANHGLTQKA